MVTVVLGCGVGPSRELCIFSHAVSMKYEDKSAGATKYEITRRKWYGQNDTCRRRMDQVGGKLLIPGTKY